MALPNTFKEMCDVIVQADILQKKDGSKFTAEEIFNYSPTGELYEIFFWYEYAQKVIATQNAIIAAAQPCGPEFAREIEGILHAKDC
jgi:hypothetical protein